MSVAADGHQGPWHGFVDLKEKHGIKLEFGLSLGNLTFSSRLIVSIDSS